MYFDSSLFLLTVILFLLGDGDRCQEMHCEIIQTDRLSSFQWKIPCFPVMKLEFARVLFKINTEILDGVIQKSAVANTRRGKFMCTSHCQIKVQDKNYTVLWKLVPIKTSQTSNDSPSVTNDHESADDQDHEDNHALDNTDESAEVRTHCLPFKVLGTCYCGSRQNALMEAYEYLYEHNRPVFVKLEAEPDNPIDKHAIAVYIMSSSNYEKVDHIARELTQFLHPLLKDPTLEVAVKKIRFSTTFLMIGFYLTINITKRGTWDKKVVEASCTVK